MDAPNRQSIRLSNYDYSGAGAYFITMCIQNRECLLGRLANGLMIMNEYGLLVDALWKDLPNHYQDLQLGAWIVMPNHVHGILILTDVGAILESPLVESTVVESPLVESPVFESPVVVVVRAIHESPLHESPLQETSKCNERRKMLLSKIVGRFKMTTGKQINLLRKTPGTAVWQRNYYEHIIRNDESFVNIENYIVNNPENWDGDKENLDRVL